ncbi:MAG: hypothetical protein RTU92_04360 [Candidatus Thorarchaeota archaeon]
MADAEGIDSVDRNYCFSELTRLAVEVLTKYGSHGNELTTNEIMFYAGAGFREINHRQMFRAIKESWERQEGIFYIIRDMIGLQSWRESKEKKIVWSLIQEQRWTRFSLIQLLNLTRERQTQMSESLVYKLLTQLVEDSLLKRDEKGWCVIDA